MTETKTAADDTGAPRKISIFRTLRNRVLAGLFVVLPIFITWLVIKWLYDTLVSAIIYPIAQVLLKVWYPEEQIDSYPLWINLLASLAAFALVLTVLFIAGMFFRSRLHRMVDWILLNVPGVKTIYSAINNVFSAISSSTDGTKFKRVVLIQFPHPGMKVPAFVTSECRDVNTGRLILCVYVPTTPVPTSGYMILVPEDEVIALNWDLQETLQAIVSGGITVPKDVVYDSADGPSVSPTTTVPVLTKPQSSNATPQGSDSKPSDNRPMDDDPATGGVPADDG